MALYLRIPPDQARRLDQRVQTLNRDKQDVVTDLIAGCLDQVEGGAIRTPAAAGDPSGDVLTAQELAGLLRTPELSVIEQANLGNFPDDGSGVNGVSLDMPCSPGAKVRMDRSQVRDSALNCRSGQ